MTTTKGKTDQLKLSAKELQGDPLALHMFVLVVNYNLRCVIPRDVCGIFTISPRVSILHVHLLHLWYQPWTSQITCLVLSQPEDGQTLLTNVDQEALFADLKINCKKTEYMLVDDLKAAQD